MATTFLVAYTKVFVCKDQYEKEKQHTAFGGWSFERIDALWTASIHADCGIRFRKSFCRCTCDVDVQPGDGSIDAGIWFFGSYFE